MKLFVVLYVCLQLFSVRVQDVECNQWLLDKVKKLGNLRKNPDMPDTVSKPVIKGVTVSDTSKGVCNFCAWETCNPSVIGIDENSFDPEKDAKTIWNSVGYVYIDNEEVMNILLRRTEKQRLAIADKYKELYPGHILKEDVADITYGDVRILLKALFTPISAFYAKYLNRAIVKRDIPRLTEIFTILPPCAIQEVHKQYEVMYHVNLKEAITKSLERKFPFKEIVELILILSEGNRPQPTDKRGSKEWNKRINDDAKDLEKVINQDKWEDKNKKFREIFGGRTLPELQDIIASYQKIYYDDKKTKLRNLEVDIRKARLETAEVIYMTILNIARNQPEYFALKLNQLLQTTYYMWYVDRTELNYILLGRSGIDLEEIKKAYREKYGSSLYVTILKKITRTNSVYYNVLLGIIKEN